MLTIWIQANPMAMKVSVAQAQGCRSGSSTKTLRGQVLGAMGCFWGWGQFWQLVLLGLTSFWFEVAMRREFQM